MLTQPLDMVVRYHGKPAFMRGVTMIDPKFENMEIPSPDPAEKRFMGQSTFSLPIVDQEGTRVMRWIVVPRQEMQMLGGGGKAYIASRPEGVKVPLDWADVADIMNNDSVIAPTIGGNFEFKGFGQTG